MVDDLHEALLDHAGQRFEIGVEVVGHTLDLGVEVEGQNLDMSVEVVGQILDLSADVFGQGLDMILQLDSLCLDLLNQRLDLVPAVLYVSTVEGRGCDSLLLITAADSDLYFNKGK